MTTIAFVLVLGSAVSHATWNFLLKKSDTKTAFLWSFGVVSFVLFLVPAVALIAVEGIGPKSIMFGVVSAMLHGAYGLSLSRSYQLGDLSTVYPISRGMGPALVPLVAVVFLDESISLVAAFGIGLIVAGIYAVNIDVRSFRDLLRPLQAMSGPATGISLLTGLLIVSYSVWDKAALDHLSPVPLFQFSMAGHMLVLAPIALRDNASAVRHEWRERRTSILAAGVVAPVAYLLVLTALTTSRVSYVAPTREIGIVFGAALGVLLLGEGRGLWRIVASLVIVAGALTLGLAP